MKHFFAFRLFLLVCSLGLLAWQPAQASHAQGGQLTYSYVGTAAFPNRYRVELQFFRDCAAIVPSTTSINCRAGSCNGTLVTGTMTQVGQPVIGQPYCPATQATVPCNLTGSTTSLAPYNYAIYTYETLVDLPPAVEWVISWEESARIITANIAAGTLRLEATLNNLITPTGGTAQGIVNNSPVFSAVNSPAPFVYANELNSLSFSAHDDADRVRQGQADSLVFSMERPLNGCGTYETYLANNSSLPCQWCYMGPVCLLICDYPVANVYSPAMPLPVGTDTLGHCPMLTVRPSFHVNASSGSFTFHPSYWNPNVSTNFNSLNKYVLVGKVTEYRKIAGRYYKVGSVRRDLLVTVVQGTAHRLPIAPVATITPANSGAVATIRRDTTDITVLTCNYSQIDLHFDSFNITTSPLNNRYLTLYHDADLNTSLLQNGDLGSFQVYGNGTMNVVGRFIFQPAPSMAGTTFVTTIRVEDDACPIKGMQYRAVRVRVVAGSAARVAAGNQGTSGVAAICTSSPTIALRGIANRPDSLRVLAAGITVAQSYTYQWTAAANSGLPANTTTASITVAPTTTTRYHLRITPRAGFGANGGGCGDTTSVLVRVLSAPAPPTVTRSGNTLTSSATTGNQWYLNGQPLVGATGQTIAATASGTYTVTAATVAGAVSCPSAASAPVALVLASQQAQPGTSLSIVPNPTLDGHLNVLLTGYQEPVSLTLFDALGRAVRQARLATPNPQGTSQPLDIAPLPAGVYVLQVRTAKGVDTRRIVRE